MSRNYFDFCRAVRDLTYEGGERLCTVMMYLSAPSDGGNTGQSHSQLLMRSSYPPGKEFSSYQQPNTTNPPTTTTFNFQLSRSSKLDFVNVEDVSGQM